MVEETTLRTESGDPISAYRDGTTVGIEIGSDDDRESFLFDLGQPEEATHFGQFLDTLRRFAGEARSLVVQRPAKGGS